MELFLLHLTELAPAAATSCAAQALMSQSNRCLTLVAIIVKVPGAETKVLGQAHLAQAMQA
jgi:hypothetical protein